MKFWIQDFYNKFHLIRSFLWIWFSLLKKFLLENVISMSNEEWAIPNFFKSLVIYLSHALGLRVK